MPSSAPPAGGAEQKIYIGETDNLTERLIAHNDHRFGTSYTARFDGSWELVHHEQVTSRQEARKREKQLKSYRGREFIRNKINNSG
ncbi:GIY-YIG nuclease family protein [Candidatus Berkelbacteria bacterium]|nr:GIY-YIG nuclease family protein [Candidatus Berkelbacteria bacterium]